VLPKTAFNICIYRNRSTIYCQRLVTVVTRIRGRKYLTRAVRKNDKSRENGGERKSIKVGRRKSRALGSQRLECLTRPFEERGIQEEEEIHQQQRDASSFVEVRTPSGKEVLYAHRLEKEGVVPAKGGKGTCPSSLIRDSPEPKDLVNRFPGLLVIVKEEEKHVQRRGRSRRKRQRKRMRRRGTTYA